MGTDNLHHKDKKCSARSLERQRAKRRPYDRVLIVCEGAKTEPGYFEELKSILRYVKGREKILAEITKSRQLALEEVIDYAIRNGQQLEQQQNRQYSDNPSTRLHQLVAYLRDLNKAF